MQNLYSLRNLANSLSKSCIFFQKLFIVGLPQLSYMYAKLCNIEVLPSYIKEVAVGDILTVQALITNPLDWQHFYDKISTIKIGNRTDFTVVTQEGDRVVGSGNIIEVDKWSNRGHYGFKIKISVKKQKSLTDRRIRGPSKAKQSSLQAEKVPDIAEPVATVVVPHTDFLTAATNTTTTITAQDINAFHELLKGSLTMDMTA
jgi:RNase P protein component